VIIDMDSKLLDVARAINAVPRLAIANSKDIGR